MIVWPVSCPMIGKIGLVILYVNTAQSIMSKFKMVLSSLRTPSYGNSINIDIIRSTRRSQSITRTPTHCSIDTRSSKQRSMKRKKSKKTNL